MKKEKTMAVIFVYDANRMSNRGRKRIAEWLRKQAAFIQKFGKDISPSFRAKISYTPEEKS